MVNKTLKAYMKEMYYNYIWKILTVNLIIFKAKVYIIQMISFHIWKNYLTIKINLLLRVLTDAECQERCSLPEILLEASKKQKNELEIPDSFKTTVQSMKQTNNTILECQKHWHYSTFNFLTLCPEQLFYFSFCNLHMLGRCMPSWEIEKLQKAVFFSW